MYDLPQKTIEDFKILELEEKNMIADKSYYQNEEDPLVRLLGPEHGERSQTISSIIGPTKVSGRLFKNVKKSRNSIPRVDTSPPFCQSNGVSGGRLVEYPPIEVMTTCDFLLKVADTELKVASGMAWPTSEMVIHSKPVNEGCVKVQVDEIIEIYEVLPVHVVTRTDEVEFVKHLLHTIIQWLRNALKLVNKTPSKSNSGTRMGSSRSSPQIHVDDTTNSFYRPQFEENHFPYHHQMDANEPFQDV
uniref:DUF8039 domain-containing protein n=1 Tax=Lactuca sativa TaxID=4236 RepID=A0A9R1V301_LACSA|nr:hypothetical protein LSAT_V11C700370730 [Lactuca sativa]